MAANISVDLKIHPVLRMNVSATLSESLGASTQKADCDGTLLGEEELDQSTASTQYRAGSGPWMNILWAGTTGWSTCPCCLLCALDSSVLSLHVYTSLLTAVPSQRWVKVVWFFFFLPLQRMGTEKQPLDSHGSIHVPEAHCGPSWHISAPGASSKGGGFLHLPPP